MKPIKKCCFCDVNNGKFKYPNIDVPFALDDTFFAVASIGALIEGWSLVIPKKHCVSLKHIYGDPKLKDFINKFLPELTNHYGKVIAFEHGANMEGSLTGCGTNHAHLHLVPLAETLLPEIKKSGLLWEPCQASQIASKTRTNEYLFYADLEKSDSWEDPMGHIHVLQTSQSQFFRKLIAQKLGVPSSFDYKDFPHLAVAAKTRKVKPPEPYKGKGIRYLGEEVRRKAGKKVVTGGAGGG